MKRPGYRASVRFIARDLWREHPTGPSGKITTLSLSHFAPVRLVAFQFDAGESQVAADVLRVIEKDAAEEPDFEPDDMQEDDK